MGGALGMNSHYYQLLFNEISGPGIFSSTMSMNRFDFLHENISFDDFMTIKDRWLYDKFAAMRKLFETFNRNCGMAVNASDFLWMKSYTRVKTEFDSSNTIPISLIKMEFYINRSTRPDFLTLIKRLFIMANLKKLLPLTIFVVLCRL